MQGLLVRVVCGAVEALKCSGLQASAALNVREPVQEKQYFRKRIDAERLFRFLAC